MSFPLTQTVNGAVTAWLPLSTPGVLIPACSSQIYAQVLGFFAFNPLFGLSISPNAPTCLPTEVTASWSQQLEPKVPTTTLLGPTFVCPAAYSAVTTIMVDITSQQILCCPSYVIFSFLISLKHKRRRSSSPIFLNSRLHTCPDL